MCIRDRRQAHRNRLQNAEQDEGDEPEPVSYTHLLLDEATDPWGIKVGRVELKNIIPPREIQDAMEKQMKAERERRESILQAEGQKQSQILVAEGEKQSPILRAEAVSYTHLVPQTRRCWCRSSSSWGCRSSPCCWSAAVYKRQLR